MISLRIFNGHTLNFCRLMSERNNGRRDGKIFSLSRHIQCTSKYLYIFKERCFPLIKSRVKEWLTSLF